MSNRDKADAARYLMKQTKDNAGRAKKCLEQIGDKDTARKAGAVEEAAREIEEHIKERLDPEKRG